MTDNNNITDDQLSQFLAFTGSSDPNIARQYLEMSGNQLEMAVSLFMDHNNNNNNNNGGGSGMGGGVDAGGIMGGSPQVRAPDATRSMRLVGGPPSPGGGHHPADAAAAAALMAAVGGPNAAQMMMMGGVGVGMNMNNNDQQDAMEDIMASTWASRDLRETVNRAAAAAAANASSSSSRGRNRRNRSGSGASRNHGGSSGGNNNNNNNNNDQSQSSRRRRTGSRSHSSSSGNNHHRNNNNNDDDEVQVLDEDGNVVGEVMEESDDEDSYNYNDQSDDEDDDDSMGGGAEPILPTSSNRQHNHPPSLSTMFQAPNHLIHRAGGFLGAKNFAKDARRWLLVNIQTEDDFACHALNRDVWHDELVENLVREGFVFWQIHSTTPEGLTYCQRYKVEGYPHIAILDPRTGSLLYRKEGWTQVNPLTAEQFVEIASDFCSRHSFDKLPMPARHGYASNGGVGGFGMGGGGGGESSRPAKRPVHELSEQEQLEAAIRASMQDAASGGEQQQQQQHSDDDDDEVEILEKNDIIGKSQEEDTTTTTTTKSNGGDDNDVSNTNNNNNDDEDESKLSPFEKEILSMTVPPEPTSSTCRVQFRMPDGKRLIRKFDSADHVKVIYAFVAQQLLLDNNDGVLEYKPFELKAKFPPVDLMTFVEESISSCGLSGEAITFLWK